ncbi:UNVERIFIED_CONTAM: putative ribonuclease H protein [Sesamum latifolium]|uniref:Ribonuclease H protein n=1 Tax=Sesamum latifolium TaxID=2727402 RepID=A0AAW2U544_9LAMI
MQIRTENRTALYLGLPSSASRSKKELFASVRDRVWHRINDWNEKILSQAGKEILIKAVIQAIPSYAMACFRLPESLLHELQRMVSGFWWHNRGVRKIHWVTWKRMCESKLIGGLGFRSLKHFNTAMLAKHWWRFLRNSNSLVFQVLCVKYFPSGNISDARLGYQPSFTWRSIMSAKKVFMASLRWRIGLGTMVKAWSDPWIPRLWSFRLITPPSSDSDDMYVVDFIDQSRGEWGRSLLEQKLWQEDVDRVLEIPLSAKESPDTLVWHFTQNGIFSVKSAYHLACRLESQEGPSTSQDWLRKWWINLWKAKIPNKIKVFTWRACLQALPTSRGL